MEIDSWRRAIFVDFEGVPDSNGSLFPVEIGVANIAGQVQARWIAPRQSWLPAAPSWRDQGQKLATAIEKGLPANTIAQWISRNFTGRVLVSDAAFVDGPMLSRILEETDHVFRFVEFFAAIDNLRERANIDQATFNQWIGEIDEKRGEAHTAGEDARVRAVLAGQLLATLSKSSR